MSNNFADLTAIKQIASDWDTGWDNGDVEALLSLYADNPVLLPQGQPAIIGKDAIGSMYQSVFKDYIIEGKGEVVKVESSGNLGYFWSSYTLIATPIAGGAQITSRGKSIFILKRQDDNSWKIALLMDNSDAEA